MNDKNKVSSTDAKTELKSLQILRAVAAISVVYYHVTASPNFGSFGVDIFFVISGFVMAMIVTKGQSNFDFAMHRLARIVPLYWALTTFLLLIAWLAPDVLNSTTANFQNYAKSLFFIPYFKEDGSLRPLLAVGWTLNYEMFFYLSIWLALLLTKRFFLQLSSMLILAAYVYGGYYAGDRLIATFFQNPQLLEFVMGMLAFKLWQLQAHIIIPTPVAIILGIGSYLFMALAETFETRLNGLVVYGLPSLLLLFSMLNLEPLFANSQSSAIRLCSSMGDASYATYLSHYYVVELVRKFGFQKYNMINPYTPMGVAVIVLTSLLLGQLLYKWIDKPLTRYVKGRCALTRSAPHGAALLHQD
jgi:exopolysaccharide production protein ExoZ